MHHHKGAGGPAPTGHGVWNDLLVIADATAQIAHPSDEANLLHRRFIGTRPYKHVADLSDFTFRLLIGVPEFLTKRLAVDVLCGPDVHA